MNCIMCNKENAEVKINDKIAMCQKCSDQETEDMERIDEFIIKGHSDHCACRLVWGDGECECHLRKEKTMNWKQFLTEKVLKERILVEKPERCKTCKGLDCNDCADNRTFDNRNDLLDLYEAINRKRDFWQFEKVCWEALKTQSPGKTMQDILNNVTPWMFCFSGEGYEDRCRMAAEFYGWEASHDRR